MKYALLSICAFAMLSLGACTTTTASNGTTVTSVSLSVVQSEIRAIDGAIDTLAPTLEVSMASATASKAKLAVTSLDTAASAAESLTAGESVTTILETFDGAAQGVVAILPLPAATGTAIEAGLVIADAFLAGLPTATIPAAAAPSTAAAALGAPPVAIPLQ